MTYSQWAETLGANRWKDREGKPRVYVPLDYQWEPIFERAIQDADRVFWNWKVWDTETFTQEFISMVPEAWLKFKTSVEMLLGTLDGTNIDPEEFHAGFTRTTEGGQEDHTDAQSQSNSCSQYQDTNGSRQDESKARGIQYQQGVQAYDNEITNDNIGELGNDYASGMTDQVNQQSIGQQSNDGSASDETSSSGSQDRNTTYSETVKETRINYYDQLAFLRERFDRLNAFKTFTDYFRTLFIDVDSFAQEF